MADGTRIEIRPPLKPEWRAEDDVEDGVVVWTVTGTISSIAEIGEILAWLGAALSLSSIPYGICASDPVLNNIPTRAGGLDRSACCKISSNLYPEAPNTVGPHRITSGNCWAELLGNTVYVKGYPTARRTEHHTGMEISLATMISLVRSRRLGRFADYFCIKGYCSLILPTRRQGDFIYWHLVTNRSGKYLPYTDNEVRRLWEQYPQDLDIKVLEKSRHILGWCDTIQNLAGMCHLNMLSIFFLSPFLLDCP